MHCLMNKLAFTKIIWKFLENMRKKQTINRLVADTTNSFRFIDGRRYHNAENSKYPLPNDDDECDRLHIQHFILRYVWQGNFASPVEYVLNRKGAKILDSGYVMTLSLYFCETHSHQKPFHNLKMWCGFLVV